MDGARIITLIDNPESVGEVTFEEAFGEQSELRGRGRARRQARRMERINNRRERKSAKQQARQERKRNRVEGRVARKAMKGQGQRDEAMADAENEQAVEALNPQEDESTGYESQDSGDSGYDQAPEELDQNSGAEEEESEFEAGSTSEYASSFDAESSDASGKKPGKPIKDKIQWHKKIIALHTQKIADNRAALQAGKLPSNEVAKRARDIKQSEWWIKRSEDRLPLLMRQLSEEGNRGVHGKPNRLTPVSKNLNAKIEPNKIEVPASSAEGNDAFNCADGDDDFSGFDAKEIIKKNKNVLIGVGVAAAVIVGLHVAGVFKK